MKKLISLVFLFALAINSILFILSFFGKTHWVLEILSHLRLQYGIGFFILGAIILIINRNNKIAWVAIILGILILLHCNLSQKNFNNTKMSTHSKSLANLNLYSLNKDAKSTLDEIKNLDADVICFQEYNKFWQGQLSKLNQFPYRVEKVQEGHFGIAIYSKIPFKKQEIIDFADGWFPSIWVEFDELLEEPIGILNTHIEPPIGRRAHDFRVKHYANMTKFLKARNCEYILTGDLNTTPYSYHLKNLIEDLSLQNSRSYSLGTGATWPSVLGMFGIPIDHILGTKQIKFHDLIYGNKTGSDHLGLLVDFSTHSVHSK